MLGFQATLLLCAVGTTLAQVDTNVPIEGRSSSLEEQRQARLFGLGQNVNDVNRAGFPGGRPLLPGNRPFVNPLSAGLAANPANTIFENNGDGNYRWAFETPDGTRSEQTGIFKQPDPINPEGVQAVQGSYSYISPEGIPITVNYIADENGYRATGDHIPSNGNPNPLANFGQFGQFGAGGIRAGLNNRFPNNFNSPLGTPAPSLSPAALAAGAGAVDAFGRPLPVPQNAAAAAAQAALLRNPGAVRPGSPAEIEFLAQQENLRRNQLGNKFNINNNRFPYNNNFNGRFQDQNPAFGPFGLGGRGAASGLGLNQNRFPGFP